MKWIGLLLLLVAGVSQGDDLDLYRSDSVAVPARIMLLIDVSRSMTEKLDNDPSFRLDSGFVGPCDVPAPDSGHTDYSQRKICIVKRTLTKFLDEGQWPDSFQVGVSIYNEPGASIIAEIQRLDATINAPARLDSDGNVIRPALRMTYRQYLRETINEIAILNYTPLLGSYLEVAEYLTGGRVLMESNQSISTVFSDANPTRFKRGMSITDSMCTSNDHLVVLTDGYSWGDDTSSRDGLQGGYTLGQRVQQFVNGNVTDDYLPNCGNNISTGGSTTDTRIFPCLNAVADSMVDPVAGDPEKVTGIRTHVIAFNIAPAAANEVSNPEQDCELFDDDAVTTDPLLAWAQTHGQGVGVSANNERRLECALQSVTEPVKDNATFTAAVPGVGINQANRFTHMDELYFSVFKPSDKPFWYGNLKKYRLGMDGDSLAVFGTSYSGDTANRNADDDQDGLFDMDVFDLWFDQSLFSTTTYPGIATSGGDKVFFGGSASQIDPDLNTTDERNLYTTNHQEETVNLNDSIRRNALRTEVLGSEPAVDDVTNYDNFLAWLRGLDAAGVTNEWQRLTGVPDPVEPDGVFKTERTLYGAPIHSAPALVNYTSRSTTGLPLEISDQTNLVFVSTNDGKLYAVDSVDGKEKLSFMPRAFLQRPAADQLSTAERMYQAARSDDPGNFIYGLDSSWTVWRQDMNGDGNITTTGTSNDFVYLYGGMRRGGRNYYGLDMTKAADANASMSQMFVLEGGETGTEFENMGQTWSEPELALIKFNGRNEVVMIVGGGYDPLYDGGRPDGVTPQGNALYFVRARAGTGRPAGDVLWWTSSALTGSGNHVTDADLTDSIPSRVKVLDKDGDGFADHIYVGDLGGQLHRFDIQQSVNTEGASVTTISHDLVAQLGRRGGSDAVAADRRFFHPPSVAIMQDGTGRYAGVAIASGLQTSPKDEAVDERFYFIKDREPFTSAPQGVLTHVSTGEGSTDLELVDLQVVDDDGSALAGSPPAASDTQLNAARGYSAPLLLQAEKSMGSPLIIKGTVVYTTYNREQQSGGVGDPDSGSSSTQCTGSLGSAALYSFSPEQGFISQDLTRMPQTLAGNIAVLFPTDGSSDSGDDSSDLRDVQGWGGGPSGAIDLPDLDLGNIRKTRWVQCPPGSAACN